MYAHESETVASKAAMVVHILESKHYSARGATFINTIFVDDRHLAEPGPLTAALRPKT